MSLVNDTQIIETVRRIASRITNNVAYREDLTQEGLIHIWKKEIAHPGQTTSWYLQAGKYHMLNCHQKGRSIDSIKRGSLEVEFLEEELKDKDPLEELQANDALTQLATRLHQKELEVLHQLLEGSSAREISRQLKITHPTVLKRRKRIARIAKRMELLAA